jgi:hypothetical protein
MTKFCTSDAMIVNLYTLDTKKAFLLLFDNILIFESFQV